MHGKVSLSPHETSSTVLSMAYVDRAVSVATSGDALTPDSGQEELPRCWAVPYGNHSQISSETPVSSDNSADTMQAVRYGSFCCSGTAKQTA